MLKGRGGNTAVFIASTGAVVVDTKLPGRGQLILDKIKELTDRPVTTIINTHTHGDHVSRRLGRPGVALNAWRESSGLAREAARR